MADKTTKKKTSDNTGKDKKSKAKRSTPSWINKSNATFVFGGLVFGLLIGLVVLSSGITGAAVSKGDLGVELKALFPQIEITDVEDAGSVYLVSYTARGMPGEFYVTKDGGLMLVGQAIDLKELAAEKEAETGASSPETTTTTPKSDRPEVEVFVMSYCPFGLQMEKAVLPVQDLLKDSADFSIKFVHYIMHGEKEAEENARHYCMQKDEPEKFWDYLECFIRDGEGKEDACMDEAGINKAKVAFCVTAARKEFKIDEDLASGEQFPRFQIDAEASEAYGVRGSPAIVINGQLIEVGRTPEGVKQAVCSAFNTAPQECETALSTAGSNPGFGFAAGASDSSATCG